MKIDEAQLLSRDTKQMDDSHKQLWGILLDISERIAKKDYNDQDIDEYSSRLNDLIDNDKTSTYVDRGNY